MNILSTSPACVFLIAITAIISYMAFGNLNLKEKLLFFPWIIKNKSGGFYRFLSHGFIHADTTHLLFNMITLFFFGPYVEQYLNQKFTQPMGSLIFLALYISAIIVATIISYLRHSNNQYYRSLGASGAVSAILFASILISPMSKIYIFFIPIGIPAYIFGPLYLVYTVYMDKRGKDNVGHDAHFMGAIYGLAAIVLLVPDTFGNFIEQIFSFLN